jgi:hypothetical protein
MGKSLGNSIPLSADPDEIPRAVERMYTDPDHLRVSDPGQVEGNVVFTYQDAFEEDTLLVDELKTHYRRGDSEIELSSQCLRPGFKRCSPRYEHVAINWRKIRGRSSISCVKGLKWHDRSR